MIYQTIRAEMTVLPPKVMNSLSIMKKPLESAVLANSVIYSFKTRLDCRKTDMCAVVGHQVAEFNTAISCPVNNLRCNRRVQNMITLTSRHHSTQGKVESEDSARSFCWCASELTCLMKTTAPLSA